MRVKRQEYNKVSLCPEVLSPSQLWSCCWHWETCSRSYPHRRLLEKMRHGHDSKREAGQVWGRMCTELRRSIPWCKLSHNQAFGINEEYPVGSWRKGGEEDDGWFRQDLKWNQKKDCMTRQDAWTEENGLCINKTASRHEDKLHSYHKHRPRETRGIINVYPTTKTMESLGHKDMI